MCRWSERLCKEVGDIVGPRDVTNKNLFLLNIMSESVIFDVDMLGFCVINRRAIRYINGCLAISKNQYRLRGNAEFLKELNSSNSFT